MDDSKKLLLARNEIENKINEVQATLQLSEMEMMVVAEMALGTSRYKAFMRSIYSEVKSVETEEPVEVKEEDK